MASSRRVNQDPAWVAAGHRGLSGSLYCVVPPSRKSAVCPPVAAGHSKDDRLFHQLPYSTSMSQGGEELPLDENSAHRTGELLVYRHRYLDRLLVDPARGIHDEEHAEARFNRASLEIA